MLDSRTEKAFEFSSDSTKVLLTLSAATVAVTVTLVTDVGEYIGLLGAVWVSYFVSILAGVWKLGMLTRELERAASADRQPSLSARAIVVPARIQAAGFRAATGLLIAFGVLGSSTA